MSQAQSENNAQQPQVDVQQQQPEPSITDKVSMSKFDNVSKLAQISNNEPDGLSSASENFEHKEEKPTKEANDIGQNGTHDSERDERTYEQGQQNVEVEEPAENEQADEELKEQIEERMEALEQVHQVEIEAHEHHTIINEPMGVDLAIEERVQMPSMDLNNIPSEMPDKAPILVPNNSLANIGPQFDYSVLLHANNRSTTKTYTQGPNNVYVFGSAECDQFYIDDEHFESKRPVEVPYFGANTIRIVQIACGSQHTAVLDQTGAVHTWGNADDGCLGRAIEERSTIPGRVELNEPVDLLSAGDSHTIAGSSVSGNYFYWGVLKSALSGKLLNEPLPKKYENYVLKRKGITDIVSGYNHILLLSGGKVYSWGDNDTGALGSHFREGQRKHQVDEPRALVLRNVTRIYAGGNHSFFITKNDKVYVCGLNNYGQLGFESSEDDLKETLPVELPELKGEWIKDIRGGEHHTLILTHNGWVFGAGRNDDGQLGKLDNSTQIAGFTRLSHLPAVDRIWSSHHFNYAEDSERENFYSWGMGFSYVLANGDEETVEESFKVSNERFFKGAYPSGVDLGHSHVVFSVNALGDKKMIVESMQNYKKQFTRAKSNKPAKKVKKA